MNVVLKFQLPQYVVFFLSFSLAQNTSIYLIVCIIIKSLQVCIYPRTPAPLLQQHENGQQRERERFKSRRKQVGEGKGLGTEKTWV